MSCVTMLNKLSGVVCSTSCMEVHHTSCKVHSYLLWIWYMLGLSIRVLLRRLSPTKALLIR